MSGRGDTVDAAVHAGLVPACGVGLDYAFLDRLVDQAEGLWQQRTGLVGLSAIDRRFELSYLAPGVCCGSSG